MAVLFKAGDQVPVILLLEVVGKADKLPPEQIAGTCVNVGVVEEFIVKLTSFEYEIKPVEWILIL